MAQYPIPQFIEEEGKIVFFLTFRQFFLLVGGIVICAILYYFLPFWIFIILSLIIIPLVITIAFIKINNESVLKLFLNFINYSAKNKNYVWKKEESLPQAKVEEIPQMEVEQKQAIFKTQLPSRLKEIKKTIELKTK